MFKPLDKMWERVDVARDDSDTALFFSLLYLGEMVQKIIAAGLLAAIADDRQRNRYRLVHSLIRADGLGEWSDAIDDALIGPASQHLVASANEEQRELTQRCGPGTWQHEAVDLLHRCVKAVDPNYPDLGTKIDGKKWFSLFVRLRNKTRGHGAPQPSVCNRVCRDLEQSIRLLVGEFRLFKRQWAYLYRNLSGKYRVTRLTDDSSQFDELKTIRSGTMPNLCDGVYVHYGEVEPLWVELIASNVEALDFFFPNGGFNEKRFEQLSYITGSTIDGDAAPYMAPATELPPSETQGIGTLAVQGKTFGNLPPVQSGYIHRNGLENELLNALLDDRHPVVTLVGRGGIGKTWLALTALHQIANQEQFAAILWFSARDIDLLQEGPKLVTPHVLSESDIATEFVRLIKPALSTEKVGKRLSYLTDSMRQSEVGPILFVFDNFETVRSPVELYTWIDTYIRLPNKVLITTRFREFKSDYYVEVYGMNVKESDELIEATTRALGIRDMLTPEYRDDLFDESDGHPYVIKILLGEVAKANKLVKIERIVASQEDILDALFERTFAGLSPVAKRVFLILSNWRSAVPQLALEAVLIRSIYEKMDVAGAIDELWRSSFIEIVKSEEDNEPFLTVPLVASVFGKRKLAASPTKNAVDVDVQNLQAFGATQDTDIRHGIAPRVERLFRYIANRLSQGKESLADNLPMLEFISRKYPRGWLLLASLHEESEDPTGADKAKEAIRRFLELAPQDTDRYDAWKRLADLCLKTEDWLGEAHALVEMCKIPGASFRSVSSSANRLNQLFYHQYLVLDSDEKQILVQQLVSSMAARISEADATDCSRIAWLCLHARDTEKAKYYTELGLRLEPDNDYCQRLLARF